jgi:GNAT superfamily N-acetyltransferase
MTLPAPSVPTEGFRGGFESQVGQYPKSGPPGISYFLGVVNIGDITGNTTGKVVGRVLFSVDNLLYRNSKGAVIGILQYFPDGAPMDLEKPGNVNVFVHPRRRRRGIASSLVAEAQRRWGPLDMDQQMYTPEGRALVENLVAKGVLDA